MAIQVEKKGNYLIVWDTVTGYRHVQNPVNTVRHTRVARGGVDSYSFSYNNPQANNYGITDLNTIGRTRSGDIGIDVQAYEFEETDIVDSAGVAIGGTGAQWATSDDLDLWLCENLSGALVTSVDWGRIIGTLSDQTDLQAALDLKQNLIDNIVPVNAASDFPAAVSGVITLANNTLYWVTTDIDLNGDRLVCGDNTAIVGNSSESSSLTSTGLITDYLITTEFSFPMRDITIKDVAEGISINQSGLGSDIAIDWGAVNFEGCTTNVICGDVNNFIFINGAVLGSGTMIFNGTIGTVGFSGSIFIGDGTAYNIMDITSTAVITRRFRIIYSSFVAFTSTVGVNVDVAATIPDEKYILDTVDFSGGGTYLSGIDQTYDEALFIKCDGIVNTFVNGQMYMVNNATATVIADTVTFVKVLGTTIPSADNQKYLHSNNRLTNDAAIERKYLINCTLAFTSGANNVCEFGFYDSKLAAVRTPSRTLSTANAAGRAESVHFSCVVQHSAGDYIEIWAKNTTAVTNITVTDMNVIITQIG